MATGIEIDTLTNNLNGTTAAAVLSGTPNGAVSFVASRTPDMADEATVASVLTAGVYTVTLPAPVLWYIAARDTDGDTLPKPVWVGASDDMDLNLCGEKIAKILNDNRAALNVALGSLVPGLVLKDIVYGTGAIVRDFPSILVTKANVSASRVAFPFTWNMAYSFEIFTMILHQDRTNYTKAATSFMGRIMQVLNQPAYFAMLLESGTVVNNCGAMQGDADDVQLDENKFGALGSLVWRGDALLIDSIKKAP